MENFAFVEKTKNINKLFLKCTSVIKKKKKIETLTTIWVSLSIVRDLGVCVNVNN